MESLVLFLIFTLPFTFAYVDLNEVRCLVCKAIVDEFEVEVGKLDPSKEIEIGQYRLDSKGNAIQKRIPLAESEVHLSDMLEIICKKMDDYVRATYKSNGTLMLLKLVSGGHINPLLGEVDIIQDGDLNKSLEFYCTEVVNENESMFIKAMIDKQNNAKFSICTEQAEYCAAYEEEAEDTETVDETEGKEDIEAEQEEEKEDFKDEL